MLQHKRCRACAGGCENRSSAPTTWPGTWKFYAQCLGVLSSLPLYSEHWMETSRHRGWSEPHPWWLSVSLGEFLNLWLSLPVQKKWLEMPSFLRHLEVQVWTNVNLFWAFQKDILLRVHHTLAFGRCHVLSHFVCTNVCPVRKESAVGPALVLPACGTSLQSV